jgi:hypothetical protein
MSSSSKFGDDVEQLVRASSALAPCSSAGISRVSRLVSPRSSSQTIAFIDRSMTPSKPPSAPIGSWIGTALAPRRSRIIVDAALEVGADAVHLVDEADARDVVLVGLAPDRLGLGLDAGDGVEHRDRAVEHAQRALDLDGEVDVAGRVDDVDPVSRQKQVVAAEVMVIPRSCSWTIQSMVAAPSWTSPIL